MALILYKKSVKWIFWIFYFLAYFPYFEKIKGALLSVCVSALIFEAYEAYEITLLSVSPPPPHC
jgi:hypothetical protein